MKQTTFAVAILAAIATAEAIPAHAATPNVSAPAGHDDPAEFAPRPVLRAEATSAPAGHADPSEFRPHTRDSEFAAMTNMPVVESR